MESRPPPGAPMTRGMGMHGTRAAALEMWGADGLRAIGARLPAATRVATLDEILLPVSWYPTQYSIDWLEAIWDGPAGRVDATLCAFVDRSIELGFGRMRRFFLRLASAELMIGRAPQQWRDMHTHGTLTATLLGRDGSMVIVRNHPYTKTALSRRVLAEAYRHLLTLSGRREARETHGVEGPDALYVRLTWS